MFLNRISTYALQRPLRLNPCVRALASDAAGDRPPNNTTAEDAPKRGSSPADVVKQAVSTLLHGSEGNPDIVPHSGGQTWGDLLSRAPSVYLMEVHNLVPGTAAKYNQAAQKYHAAVHDADAGARLFGAWRVSIGRNVDQALHVWRFSEGYGAVDRFRDACQRESGALADAQQQLGELVRRRERQGLLEFAFWATTRADPSEAADAQQPQLYELRSYQLRPGTLLEWETLWQRGLECRRQHCRPVAAFFSQLGALNMVHHLWAYPDLAARRQTRERAWEQQGWADTVHQTVPLIQSMESRILSPISPVEFTTGESNGETAASSAPAVRGG